MVSSFKVFKGANTDHYLIKFIDTTEIFFQNFRSYFLVSKIIQKNI